MKTFFLMALFLSMAALLSCNGSGERNLPGAQSNTNQPSSPIINANDNTIIDNLKKHYQLEPKEMGGDGRCLFHSLREQITQAELVAVKAKWPKIITDKVDTYSILGDDAKANILREIAMWEEKDFIDTKNKKALKYNALSPDEQAWVQEMAKDWYQEIAGSSADKTRDWFNKSMADSSGQEAVWQFVIANRDAYWAKTSCETNWAGTAEAIAIACAINRPLKMFGLDQASSATGPKYDMDGKVFPYAEYLFTGAGKKALLVFQTNGGGHYKMLVPIPL